MGEERTINEKHTVCTSIRNPTLSLSGYYAPTDAPRSSSTNLPQKSSTSHPLSILLYILYNADRLKIIDKNDLEDAIGYVDDVALLAIGIDFVLFSANISMVG